MRTDKGSASAGHYLRDFCKRNFIALISGKPCIHTPAGLVERGGKLTNFKAGESIGKALDVALGVMRTTPHTRLKIQ